MSTALVAHGLATLAGAQTPARRDKADTASDSARIQLPPLKITATRQAESIFAVPLAVSRVTRAQLDTRRGIALDEALTTIPGVLAQSRYGGSDIRLTIRGFGARGAGDRSNAGTSRGVRILIDGIPETEPDGRTSFDLVDLAAAHGIEIVRSNASALWGNAAGGVVSVSTVRDSDEPFATLQQMTGSFGLFRTTVQGGTKLGASSLGVTFTNTSQKGWREHSDSRRFLINSSLVGTLGPATDFGVFVTASNNLFHIPGPLTRDEARRDPRAANATYASRDEHRYNRVARAGLTLSRSITEAGTLSGMLFVSPKILERSERNTFREFDRLHAGGNLVYRAAFDLTRNIRGSSVVGVDRANQDGAIRFFSLAADGERGPDLRDDKREGTGNSGVFVQQSLLFGQRLNLDAGARYDNIRYDYRNVLDPGTDAARSFARVTPKFGVSYRFSPTHNFYASIGGGVEAPAGNETDPASTFGQDTVTAINPLLDAIRSTTYEVGTRRLIAFPEGSPLTSASYDAALYLTNVTNEIIPYRGGRFYFSAGAVRRSGAEFGAALTGAGSTEIRASASWSRNRYVRYTIDSVHYGRPGAVASYSGNHVAGVPAINYSATVSRPVGNNSPARVELSVRGVGDYFIDDANDVEVAGYNTYAATISSSRPLAMGRVGLHGFVAIENITNRRFIGSAFINPDIVNGEPVAFEPGTPRSLVVSLSVSSLTR